MNKRRKTVIEVKQKKQLSSYQNEGVGTDTSTIS